MYNIYSQNIYFINKLPMTVLFKLIYTDVHVEPV